MEKKLYSDSKNLKLIKDLIKNNLIVLLKSKKLDGQIIYFILENKILEKYTKKDLFNIKIYLAKNKKLFLTNYDLNLFNKEMSKEKMLKILYSIQEIYKNY